MKHTINNVTHFLASVNHRLSATGTAISLGLLLVAGPSAGLYAAPNVYAYTGNDPYAPFNMQLNIGDASTNYNVLGQVCQNPSGPCYHIAGHLVNGQLNATVAVLSAGSGTVYNGVFGSLSGTLGSSSSFFNNVNTSIPYVGTGSYFPSTYTVFNLSFNASASTVYPTGSTGSTGSSGTSTLPNSFHMTGKTGFGYTVVTLTLNGSLVGASYQVNGTILVSQYVTCYRCSPHFVYTTLNVSGVLRPGSQGPLSVTGAPPGNAPVYTGTVSGNGKSFTSLLSGLPTLGITALYINAQ